MKIGSPIDVLLLTHNDRDHVGGVPALLSSTIRIGEVWLPSDWRLLYDVGMNLVEAIRRDDADLAVVAREARDHVATAVETLRDDLLRQDAVDNDRSVEQSRRRVALRPLNNVLDSLAGETGAEVVELAGEAFNVPWIGKNVEVAEGVVSGGSPGRRARLTIRAVDAVIQWGGRVRWFSVDLASARPRQPFLPWEGSGAPGEFTIVNAWPVQARLLSPAPTAALYARLAVLYHLTIQNRRALVALGHSNFGDHVLFASDSGFEFDNPVGPEVPWCNIGAAVGLHHGSAGTKHDHVYQRFRGTAIARSGSRSATKTHPGFAVAPPDCRGCTWCHADGSRVGGLDRHRDVVLGLDCFGAWRLLSGSCSDCPRFP